MEIGTAALLALIGIGLLVLAGAIRRRSLERRLPEPDRPRPPAEPRRTLPESDSGGARATS